MAFYARRRSGRPRVRSAAGRESRRDTPDAMIDTLQHALGPSICNWLVVAASGIAFFAVVALLPGLMRRWFGKDQGPLF